MTSSRSFQAPRTSKIYPGSRALWAKIGPGPHTEFKVMEQRSSRAEMKSPGQRRGDGGGRGFHSEMAREGALAHLPSQYGRASRLSSVPCHRSSRKCAAMTHAREPNPVREATLVAPVRICRSLCREHDSGHRTGMQVCCI